MAVCEQVATLFIRFRKAFHKYFWSVVFAGLGVRDAALAPWALQDFLVTPTFPYISVRISPQLICPEFLLFHIGKYLSF